MMQIRSLTTAALLLACLVGTGAALPAQAMPLAGVSVETSPSADVIQVRDRCGRHGYHRADHRFHGRDDYYDRDDQSGVLFKSFITGTLFHPR